MKDLLRFVLKQRMNSIGLNKMNLLGSTDSDEDIKISSTESEEEIINVPTMKRTPRTRSGTKKLREEFNKSVENLITLIEHEEF
ncbi:unnamed protein product [Arabis nemorensis]|uniref:Uncharacterized protein n=1 Tax=Arabis nemorensis TaxID=586526 RepID=A0A565BJH1_9BRAS|nr:unnamed protein product [Arabis nemorensis]